MSEHNTSWFHCGRCGRLFESEPGENSDRLCTKCGFDPSPVLRETPLIPQPRSHENQHGGDLTEHRGKRTGKKRKNRYFMVKLIAGWSVLLIFIIVGARKMWHQETPESNPAVTSANAGNTLDADDQNLLNEAFESCNNAFAGYLAAGGPEQRNQFVFKPVTTASRMALFYSQNPNTPIDPTTLTPAGTTVVNFPGEKAIECRWTSKGGRTFDAVFRKENDEWRLDWDHFARYSDFPWALFLAGSGPDEAEFRLLARERLAEERKDAEDISVMLYAPRFGEPGETGFQSPEFLVSRKNRNGQLLDAAFELARKDQQVYGSKLPRIDPDGMIRIRVKVRRSEESMGRKFEITEVIACHWYAVNDPGVEPLERKPDGEIPATPEATEPAPEE